MRVRRTSRDLRTLGLGWGIAEFRRRRCRVFAILLAAIIAGAGSGLLVRTWLG
jgi:hypothetical protein